MFPEFTTWDWLFVIFVSAIIIGVAIITEKMYDWRK